MLLVVAIGAAIAFALVLIVVGIGAPDPQKTLQERLAEYGDRALVAIRSACFAKATGNLVMIPYFAIAGTIIFK